MIDYTMNDGHTIPAVGYGVFLMSPAEVEAHLPEASRGPSARGHRRRLPPYRHGQRLLQREGRRPRRQAQRHRPW